LATVDTTVELLNLLGDATRMRLLSLLGEEELSVAELTTITELPQSRVSTHLGRLREAGLLRDRKVGSSTYYALAEGAMPAEARKVWSLLHADLDDAMIVADRKRRERLRQGAKGASWPDSIAGEMERHYSPGRTWEATLRGLVALTRLGDVVDIGAGDGAITQLFASRARSITCVDRSERMVEAARRRLAGLSNVRVVRSDMESLELESEQFDQALLLNVLTYAEHPERAILEAARVLRPGGVLVVVTLAAHHHAELTAAYGHVHPGFSPAKVAGWLARAGLDVESAEVTSRERKKPYFEVLTAIGEKKRRNAAKRNGKKENG